MNPEHVSSLLKMREHAIAEQRQAEIDQINAVRRGTYARELREACDVLLHTADPKTYRAPASMRPARAPCVGMGKLVPVVSAALRERPEGLSAREIAQRIHGRAWCTDRERNEVLRCLTRHAHEGDWTCEGRRWKLRTESGELAPAGAAPRNDPLAPGQPETVTADTDTSASVSP